MIDRSLINYDKHRKFILIAWNRIRAFAMLDRPLRLTRNKYAFYPYTEAPKYLSRKKTIGELGRKYRIVNPRELSEEEERFYNTLENMTEEEYFLMVEAIRQNEFPQYPKPPTTAQIEEMDRFVREPWEKDE